MVSTHGGLRRRAWLEHAALPRRGGVLSRIRRFRCEPDGARGIHRDRDRRTGEPVGGAFSAGARLARAFTDPGQTVQVVTRPEATANAARPVPGTKTWRFTASGVRDFAWAAGSGLRWDDSTWDGILV